MEIGALTPAYTPIEVFQGLDTVPEDDIYSFAVVIYQILADVHPFGGLNASKAESKSLPVPPIRTLSRRQNRVLRCGLAFRRADRASSVATFVDELSPRHSIVEFLTP